MNSQFYLDIRIVDYDNNTDMTLSCVRNQVYNVLHGAFRQLNYHYAVALVASEKMKAKQESIQLKFAKEVKFNFDIFRVFAETYEALQALIDAILGHWKIRDYTVVGSPTPVPTEKITAWLSYRRFRIPSQKAEIVPKNKVDKQPLYIRRRQFAQQQALPYLQVRSQSTGYNFSIFIEMKVCDSAGQGTPDSYGFARETQPFALPVF